MLDTATRPERIAPTWVLILTGMFVAIIAIVFARMAYGLLLPMMQADLNLSFQQAGNLGTITALGYLFLVIPAGSLAARFGGKAIVLAGLLMGVIGFGGLYVASGQVLVVLLMILMGASTAFTYAPVISLLSSHFPQRRGAIIGCLNGGLGAGVLGLGFLVPYLAQAYGASGWRLAWGGFALVTAAVAVVAALVLRDAPRPAAAAGGGAAAESSVYANPRVLRIGFVYGIIGVNYIVQVVFMFSFALSEGISEEIAGRLTSLMGVLMVFSAPIWGLVSDRFGRLSTVILLLIITLIGTGVPVLAPTLAGFAAHYAILGISGAGLFTAVLAAATEQASLQQAPRVVSFVTVFYAVGQLVGPAAAGWGIERTGDFGIAFGACCLLLALATLVVMRMKRADRLVGAAVVTPTGGG